MTFLICLSVFSLSVEHESFDDLFVQQVADWN